MCAGVTELPEPLERWVQPVLAAQLVLRATPALMVTLALRAPMANQARMEQMAGAALLEQQVLKAPPALREPKGRKVGREITKPPS
jgi:hypothetical protein